MTMENNFEKQFLENEIITLKGQTEYLAGKIVKLESTCKYLENMLEHYKTYFEEKFELHQLQS